MQLTKRQFQDFAEGKLKLEFNKTTAGQAVGLVLEILEERHKIETKLLSLKVFDMKLLNQSDQAENLREALDRNEKLRKYLTKRLKSKKQDELTRILLEFVKFWGTQCQMPSYMALLQDLIENGVDFPNSYSVIQTEVEILVNFEQLSEKYELIKAKTCEDITNFSQFSPEVYQRGLSKQRATYSEMVGPIKGLRSYGTDVLTRDQMNQLNSQASFINQFILLVDKLASSKNKTKLFLELREYVRKSFNLRVEENAFLEATQGIILPALVSAESEILQPKQDKSYINPPPILVIPNYSPVLHEHTTNEVDKTAKSIKTLANAAVRAPTKTEPPKARVQAVREPSNKNEFDPSIQIDYRQERKKRFEKYFFDGLASLIEKNATPKKQLYSGTLVSEKFKINIENPSEQLLKKFKRACLKRKQKLFESAEVLIGVISCIVPKEELNQNFLQLVFFVGNKTSKMQEKCEFHLAQPKGLSIWGSDHGFETSRQPGQQTKTALLLAYNYLLFDTVVAENSWDDELRHYTAEFIVPCTICKFMRFIPVIPRSFKLQWRRMKFYSIYRSHIFELNPKIVKSPLQLLEFQPKLVVLGEFDDFLTQKKDLKLGGVFQLQDMRKEYLLKIIVRCDLSCVVKCSGLFEAQLVVQNLVYLLSK